MGCYHSQTMDHIPTVLSNHHQSPPSYCKACTAGCCGRALASSGAGTAASQFPGGALLVDNLDWMGHLYCRLVTSQLYGAPHDIFTTSANDYEGDYLIKKDLRVGGPESLNFYTWDVQDALGYATFPWW